MLYVGSHKGTVDDGYISSSKTFIKEYNERPKDFIRTVIAVGNYSDIRNLESCILVSVNAAKDNMYYNKSNGDGKFYCSAHTTETKIKIGQKSKGRKPMLGKTMSPDSKEKMSKAKKGIPSNVTGKKLSEETRKKMSLAKLGKTPWNKGLPASEETKHKISVSKKNYYDNIKQH
jgi:hypothetical protein